MLNETNYIVPTLVVDLDKLDHNLHTLCDRSGISTNKVIAVVKDSGYGIGSLEMTNSLKKQGVKKFAVAAMDEALFLRNNGIDEEIILLGTCVGHNVEIAITHNITISIVDSSQLEELSLLDNLPTIHIMVDTGMTRSGLRVDNLLSGLYNNGLSRLRQSVTGIYTHYHSSDQQDQTPTLFQHEQFVKAVDYLETRGFVFSVKHSCNSGATLFGSMPSDEFVRPGIALHGAIRRYASDTFGLQEVSTLKSTISSLRSVKAGEGVSYNHLYTPLKDSVIATIPIGYGDGLSRSLTGKWKVEINGVLYPILARVTMDFILVDVSDNDVNIGDIVTIFGSDLVSLCDLSECIDTISYEILCNTGRGANHQYMRNGVVINEVKRTVF